MKGCSFLLSSVWITVFIWMCFSGFHCAACSSGEWWESGKRWDRRAAVKGRCCVSVSVHVVSVGFQLWTPGRDGKDLSGKVGAVWRLREKRGQRLRATLQGRVTDKTFSKCRVICGGRFWVWIWDKYSCFSTFHCNVLLYKEKFLCFLLYKQAIGAFFP